MTYFPATNQNYANLWKKYRPAILRLMMDAAEGPQEYKFLKHEFESINPKEKGGYSFVLRAFQGSAVNNIKDSFLAKDLLATLQQSKTATELISNSTFEFSLDKQFLFHVTQETEVVDEVDEETIKEEIES